MSARGRRRRRPSPAREIKAEIGRIGRQRGIDGEAATLEAALAVVGKIPWVTGARRGTPEEDRRKIDVVVFSTFGPLCLQVKSSHAAAKSWARDYAHKLIEVVVATPVRETMQERVAGALWRLRRRIEDRQARAA